MYKMKRYATIISKPSLFALIVQAMIPNAVFAISEDEQMQLAIQASLASKENEDIRRAQIASIHSNNMHQAIQNSLRTKEEEDYNRAILASVLDHSRQTYREEESRRQATEAARIAAEQEAQRKAQVAARIAAEQEAQRKAQEAARIAAEQEAQRKAQEAARIAAEQEAQRKAQEAARIAAEQEAQRKAQEAARIAAEQEAQRKAQEAARIAAEQEAQRKAQVAARIAAEQEAQRKAQEAARIAAEQEAQRKAQEAARIAAEQEAQRKAQEAARIAAEQEAQRKAQEAARIAAEQEAQRKAQEAARIAAEQEAQRKAQEAARIAAEQEAQRKAQEAARIAAEQEAQRKAEIAEREAQEALDAAQEEEIRLTELNLVEEEEEQIPEVAPQNDNPFRKILDRRQYIEDDSEEALSHSVPKTSLKYEAPKNETESEKTLNTLKRYLPHQPDSLDELLEEAEKIATENPAPASKRARIVRDVKKLLKQFKEAIAKELAKEEEFRRKTEAELQAKKDRLERAATKFKDKLKKGYGTIAGSVSSSLLEQGRNILKKAQNVKKQTNEQIDTFLNKGRKETLIAEEDEDGDWDD
jgi:hypothetical protein